MFKRYEKSNQRITELNLFITKRTLFDDLIAGIYLSISYLQSDEGTC